MATFGHVSSSREIIYPTGGPEARTASTHDMHVAGDLGMYGCFRGGVVPRLPGRTYRHPLARLCGSGVMGGITGPTAWGCG